LIRYLLAEKVFNVQLFEQKPTVGGVWAYNHLTIADDDFSIPRTKPSDKADNPIVTEPENGVPQFVSPVYDSLETNIPHTLMNFIDLPFPPGTSLFPRHTVVKEYLDAYAKDLHPLIKISSQILEATKSSEQAGGWDLKVLDLKTKAVSQTRFDALVIASGHYNDPFIPDIPGLKEFNTSHPTVVSHSKFYKSPASFKDKVRTLAISS
jgi:cation diffusion facilitator CzcD-associated flavoprotein CzcO